MSVLASQASVGVPLRRIEENLGDTANAMIMRSAHLPPNE